MKAAVRLLTLVAACVGLVMMVGAPISSALLSGLIVAGMLLHGVRCEHPNLVFEPSTFQAGARRLPHWCCDECGRTWSAPLDSGADAPTSRAAAL
jgi:hypothetical protein